MKTVPLDADDHAIHVVVDVLRDVTYPSD